MPHVKLICRKDNIGYSHGGCSGHICLEISIYFLTHIDTTVTSKIKMWNGDVIEAKGKGTIKVETKREIKYIKMYYISIYFSIKFVVWGN